jgi:hypothetical protein
VLISKGYHIFDISVLFLSCLVKFDNFIRHALDIIEPPINGNPAPTKSAIFDENKNGRQKIIPNVPKIIAVQAPNFVNNLISNTFCFDGE